MIEYFYKSKENRRGLIFPGCTGILEQRKAEPACDFHFLKSKKYLIFATTSQLQKFMSKAEKLLARLLQRPDDFTYKELTTLPGHFGYHEWSKGKTSGSRVAYVHTDSKHIFKLHKPHPSNQLKRYQINEILEMLKKNGHI